MKLITQIILVLYLATDSKSSKADMWGADVVVLSEICANSIHQLYQLMAVVQTMQDTYHLMKDVNNGINDSLDLANSINPNIPTNVYKNWKTPEQALIGLESIYNDLNFGKLRTQQRDLDKNTSEAIAINNAMNDYAFEIEKLSKVIDTHSHATSPGGAQKLTAQGVGYLLQASGQSLKTQAASLKLQAQNAAIENSREKQTTQHLEGVSKDLKDKMKDQKTTFKSPRF